MKTSDVLIEAKKLIQNPKNWIKEHYSTDKDGQVLGTGNLDISCKFCSIGALQKVLKNDNFRKSSSAYFLLGLHTQEQYKMRVAEFNDCPSTTHQMIMKLWQDTIDEQIKEEAQYE